MTALREAASEWLGRAVEDAAGPPALAARRRAAAGRFESSGFPHRKQEAWRFTSTDGIVGEELSPATPGEGSDAAGARATGAEGELRVSVVDGALRGLDDADLPKGLAISALGDATGAAAELIGTIAERAGAGPRPFLDLNTALFDGGVLVEVEPGAVIDRPIHLVLTAGGHARPSISHPRVLVLAGQGSQATVIETWTGPEELTYLTNAVTEVSVGEGAVLEHVRVQLEGDCGHHIATLGVAVGRNASYRSRVASLGARLARLSLGALLEGPGADCTLDGLYVARGEQHIDHHTVVDHKEPDTTSRERYKGVMSGRSVGVFDGRVHVRQDAQRSNAHQENRNLLLSDDARIHTKPCLIIDADDVKCAHGATVGQLDEAALYYLRSRGIGTETARAMLTYGFAKEILDGIPLPRLREALTAAMLARLPGAVRIEDLA